MKLKIENEKLSIIIKNFKFWFFFFIFSFFFFHLASAYAQPPSLNLPEMPTQPLTVIFKGITRHDPFRLVIQTLKESKRVESLVMKRAQKGLIEYEGKFFGDSASLLEQLGTALEGKLKLESKIKTDGSLEIIVTTEGS